MDNKKKKNVKGFIQILLKPLVYCIFSPFGLDRLPKPAFHVVLISMTPILNIVLEAVFSEMEMRK